MSRGTGSSATPTAWSSSRASELDEVLEAGIARFENEQQMFAELKAGATTIELLGLDPSGLDKK